MQPPVCGEGGVNGSTFEWRQGEPFIRLAICWIPAQNLPRKRGSPAAGDGLERNGFLKLGHGLAEITELRADVLGGGCRLIWPQCIDRRHVIRNVLAEQDGGTLPFDVSKIGSVLLYSARCDVGCEDRQWSHVIFAKEVWRRDLLSFFSSLPACLVGVEACSSAHHWGRELTTLGHDVRLMPPAYVKPYVKRQKNDAADAAAIREAVTKPFKLVAVAIANKLARIVHAVMTTGTIYRTAKA